MATKSFEDLKIEAAQLGVSYDENTSYNDLQKSVKEARAPKELTPEEIASIKAESERTERELKDKQAERLAGEKTYSESQVKDMMRSVIAEMQAKQGKEEDDGDDKPRVHTLTIPRFANKFVFGFKNRNTDKYAPDLVVHAFDVINPDTKKPEANVTLMLEDGEELTVPLWTALTRSIGVKCDILETIREDTSYSDGKVEQVEVNEYSPKGTGSFVKLKVSQFVPKFRIRLPDGREQVVGQEIINWDTTFK